MTNVEFIHVQPAYICGNTKMEFLITSENSTSTYIHTYTDAKMKVDYNSTHIKVHAACTPLVIP